MSEAIEAAADAMHADDCPVDDCDCSDTGHYDRLARIAIPVAWPILSAGLRALHREQKMYEHEDACPQWDNEDHVEQHHHESSLSYGVFFCDQEYLGSFCAECSRNDYEDAETWPCPTMQAIQRIDKELGLTDE